MDYKYLLREECRDYSGREKNVAVEGACSMAPNIMLHLVLVLETVEQVYSSCWRTFLTERLAAPLTSHFP